MSRLAGAGRVSGAFCAASVVLACIAGSASPALAANDESTIFDPGQSILTESPEGRAHDLLEMNATGTDTVRLVVPWRSIAPDPTSATRPQHFDATDPSDYPDGAFAPVDQIVRGAGVLGMDVLMTPSSPVPDWASGTGESIVNDPDPAEFQDFVEALGHRYSGSYGRDVARIPNCPPLVCPPADDDSALPRVNHWALWNEPNIGIFLGPQFRDGHPYSPTLYRRLYLAGRDGLAGSGHRSDQVLVGETATSGGRTGINPLDFVRGVFCMDPRFGPDHPCDPLQASGFSHHPYGYSTPPQFRAPNRGLIDLATLGRLDRLLARAYEVGATSSELSVYITEFGVLSDPHPAGFSPIEQAGFMAAAEFLAWRDPMVAAFGQYLVRDDPQESELPFTTGLRYSDNSAKPFRKAFPLTLLVRRVSKGSVYIWGHVRPADRPVYASIFTLGTGGGAALLRSVVTDEHGYFGFYSPFHRDRRWQARTSLPDGRDLRGPYLPSLRFPLPR